MKKLLIILIIIFNQLNIFSQINTLSKNDIIFENNYFKALNGFFTDDSIALFNYANLAMKYNPNSAATNFLLGKYLFLKKHYQLALEYFLKAANIKPQNFWYNYYLAQTYIKLNNIDDAIKILQKISIQNNSDKLYLELIDLYIKQNYYEKAKNLSDKYLKLYGFDLNIGLKLISIYKNINDRKNLQETLEKMIINYPYNQTLYNEFWNTITKHQNFQEVIRFYNSNEILLSDYFLILLTKAYYKLGKLDSVLLFEKKLLLSPELGINDKIKSLENIKRFNNQEQLKLYQLLYTNHPYNTKACFNYALALYKNFMIDKSFSILKNCIHKLNSFDYFLVFAQILILKQNYNLLKQLMDEAIVSYPNSPEFYYLKALALLKLSEPDKAQNLINYAKMLDFEKKHQILLLLLNSIKSNNTPEIAKLKELFDTSAHKCFYYALLIKFTDLQPIKELTNICNNTFLIAVLAIKYKQHNALQKLQLLKQLYPTITNLNLKN